MGEGNRLASFFSDRSFDDVKVLFENSFLNQARNHFRLYRRLINIWHLSKNEQQLPYESYLGKFNLSSILESSKSPGAGLVQFVILFKIKLMTPKGRLRVLPPVDPLSFQTYRGYTPCTPCSRGALAYNGNRYVSNFACNFIA